MDKVKLEREVNFKKSGEDVDDLVELQQQFLQRKQFDKSYVAAKVTKSSVQNDQLKAENDKVNEDVMKNNNNLRNERLIPGIKSNSIVERDGNVTNIITKMGSLSIQEIDPKPTEPTFNTNLLSNERTEEGSLIDKMLQDIHKQNMSKLATMSQQEILEARQEILDTFDPQVVNSLLTLNRVEDVKTEELPLAEESKSSKLSTEHPTLGTTDVVDYKELELEPNTTEASLKAMKSNYFSDLPTESDKLKWMVTEPSTPTSTKSTSIRFDLEGLVLTAELSKNLTVDRGLHHHGKEPELAGYTLEEISILTRSTVARQRSIALSLLTKIFTNIRNLVYEKKTLDEICKKFKSSKADNLIYNLRVCLDDPSNLVILHAVEALGALLLDPSHIDSNTDVNTTNASDEESIWDQLVNTSQGYELVSEASLNEVDVTQVEHEGDYQSIHYHLKVVAHDTLTGLLEMGTLDRIQFLIQRQPLTPKQQHTLLKVLIKLARHSVHSSQALVDTHKLLESVAYRFLEVEIPSDDATSQHFDHMGPKAPYPNSDAIKLLTILAQNSRTNAVHILKAKYFQTCFKWLSSDFKIDELTTGLRKNIWQLLRVLVTYDLLAEHLPIAIQLVTDVVNRALTCTTDATFELEYPVITAALYFFEAATRSLYLHQGSEIVKERWELLSSTLPFIFQLLTKLTAEIESFKSDRPKCELITATLTFLNTCATLLNTSSVTDSSSLKLIDEVPKVLLSNTSLFDDLIHDIQSQVKAFKNLVDSKKAVTSNDGWNSQLRRHFPSLGSKSEVQDFNLFNTLFLNKLGFLENVLQLHTIYPNIVSNWNPTSFTSLLKLACELVYLLDYFPKRYLCLTGTPLRLIYQTLQQITTKLESEFPKFLNYTFPLALWFVTSVPQVRPDDDEIVKQVFGRWVIHPKLFHLLTVHSKFYDPEVVRKLADLYFESDGDRAVAGLTFDYELVEQPDVTFSLRPLLNLKSPSDRSNRELDDDDDAETRKLRQVKTELEVELGLRCVQVTNLIYLVLYQLNTSNRPPIPTTCFHLDMQRDRFQLLRLTYLQGTRLVDVTLVTALQDLNATLTQLSGYLDPPLQIPPRTSPSIKSKYREGEVKQHYDLISEATDNYIEQGFNHQAYLPLLFTLPLTLDSNKFPIPDFRLLVWTKLIPNCTKATLQIQVDLKMLDQFKLGSVMGKTKFFNLAKLHPQILLFYPIETDSQVLTVMTDTLLNNHIGTKKSLVWNLIKHHLKFICMSEGKFKVETMVFIRAFKKLLEMQPALKNWVLE